MKNISSLFRNLYAAVILLCVMLSATASFSQISAPQKAPFSNLPYEAYSQMWRTDGTTWYFGTVTIRSGSGVPYGSNVGSQIDTAASGSNMKLTTSVLTSGKVNVDTVVASPVPGYGSLNIKASLLNTAGTGTTTVVSSLTSSSDGYVFAPVLNPQGTAYTFTSVITSSVTPTVVKAALPASQLAGDKFYQWSFTGDGSHPYSAQAWYFWQAPLIINR